MTAIDWIVLAALAVSIGVGAWRGLVSEVLALLAWFVAFVVARVFGAGVGRWLDFWLADAALRTVAGTVLVFVAVLVLFALARWLARSLLKAIGLGPLDRLLGGLFGALRAGVVLVFVTMLAGMTRVPRENWWLQASVTPPLESAVVALKPWLPSALAQRIKYR